MTDELDDRIRENLILSQYNRASYDYRHFDQLIWQVPSIGITITSIVFAVSFGFIKTNPLMMGIVLLLGSVFEFTLLVALTKYRLMQDVRVLWMEYIEEKYHIEFLPISTIEAEKFLQTRKERHKHVSFEFFRRRNAFRVLFFTIFILFIVMILIGVYFLLLSLL